MSRGSGPRGDADEAEQRSELGGYEHAIAHPSKWPWLERGDGKGLDRHPYDPGSGLVKYVGADRALKPGAIVNLLARLRERVDRDGRKIADVQQRLILKRLHARRADDPFGLKLHTQLRMIEETVREITGFDRAYLRDKLVEAFEDLGRDGRLVREAAP